MTSVMHEFVHVHAVENGQSAFLDADEVETDHKQQAAENRPRQNLAHGDGGRQGHREGTGYGHRRLLGFAMSPLYDCVSPFQSAKKPNMAWSVSFGASSC